MLAGRGPPTCRLYHALRKCDALLAPAIFLSRDDCIMHFKDVDKDRDGNISSAVYRSFDNILDALEFVESSAVHQKKSHEAIIFSISSKKRPLITEDEISRKPTLPVRAIKRARKNAQQALPTQEVKTDRGSRKHRNAN